MAFPLNTGHVEKTNDRDYEVEERYAMADSRCSEIAKWPWNRRYRTMESAATRLQKEAKGYLDSLRGEFETESLLDI